MKILLFVVIICGVFYTQAIKSHTKSNFLESLMSSGGCQGREGGAMLPRPQQGYGGNFEGPTRQFGVNPYQQNERGYQQPQQYAQQMPYNPSG